MKSIERPSIRAAFGSLATALLLAGCGAPETSTADPTTVRVFGAASLTDAFQALELAFETEHPSYDVELNLAGSSTLQTQILAGAPVDVFASANATIMDELVSEVDVPDEPQVFATNKLQLAVPEGNPAGLTGIEDFTRPELFLGLCAETVPCGGLAAAAFAGAGIEPEIDTSEPDVRALLSKVATGELDGGMVYATDVLAADDQVDGIDLPDGLAGTTHYPIVALDQADGGDGGQAFIDFVLGPDGAAILEANGFGAP